MILSKMLLTRKGKRVILLKIVTHFCQDKREEERIAGQEVFLY